MASLRMTSVTVLVQFLDTVPIDYVWSVRREILRAFDSSDVLVLTRCWTPEEAASIGCLAKAEQHSRLVVFINDLPAVTAEVADQQGLDNLPSVQTIVDAVQLWLMRRVTCDG